MKAVMFSRLKEKLKSKPGEEVASSQATGWDSLKDVEYNGPEREAQMRRERQERKLIRTFSSGDIKTLREPDVELSNGEEDAFLDRLEDESISRNQEAYVLSMIASPADKIGKEAVFNNLDDAHMRKILAYMSGRGFSNWKESQVDDLATFYNRYPTPIEFENSCNTFLDNIRQGNGDDKHAEYIESMKKFSDTVYGKRQEYFEAMQSLHQKADARTQELTKYRGETTELGPEVRAMDIGEQREIMERATFEGDPYRIGGQEYQLTDESLRQADLLPKYMVKFDGAEIALSSRFDINGRDVVIGYVKDDEGNQHVRTYYRSNSQGNWRLLPDYVVNEKTGEGISWYGKGYNEESMTLPSDMQYAMALLDGEPRANTNNIDPEFLMCGTAQRYDSKRDYGQNMRYGTLRNSVYNEISIDPIVEFSGGARGHLAPGTVDVPAEKEPNFRRQKIDYEMRTAMYGDVEVSCFDSMDGSVRYSFNRDERGRTWVGSIETRSKINSAGLRSEWVAGGDITTPLYEYPEQTSGYGDTNDVRGRYQSMWQNYLSNVPLIQRFMSQRPRR